MKISNAVLILVFFCLISCNKPYNDYEFKQIDGWDYYDTVALSINLDTTKTANMDLCMRIADMGRNKSFNKIPLSIIFVSPSGKEYIDSVTFPLYIKEAKYKRMNGYTDIRWPYLRDIKSNEGGTWQLKINRLDFSYYYKYIMGIGAGISVQ